MSDQPTEKDFSDAPVHMDNAEAWAWVMGYNQAVADFEEWQADPTPKGSLKKEEGQ